MAKGYWIASVDVTNMDQYRQYIAANAEPFARYGARFLTRGGVCEQMEGSGRSRNVVIEFPSYQAALDCYRSPAYQAAVAIRSPASECSLVVVEGYDGPQPG